MTKAVSHPNLKLPSFTPQINESALKAWLRMPMQPIHFEKDLPVGISEIEREQATDLMDAIGKTESLIQFIYSGGSEPENSRQVLPILLFQKIDPENTDLQAPNISPIYLLAHCQTRNAPRTFRLDRMAPLFAEVPQPS